MSDPMTIAEGVDTLLTAKDNRIATLEAQLAEATALLERAVKWIDADDTSRMGPTEDRAHSRLITAIDAGIAANQATLAKIGGGA